jgi:polyphenol oxidase
MNADGEQHAAIRDRHSRRGFLGRAALVTGGLLATGAGGASAEATSHPAIIPGPGTRAGVRLAQGVVRRNIRAYPAGSPQLTKLSTALTALKRRSQVNRNDPAGFTFQAGIHDTYCDNPDPNVRVHNSWKFLPWHRGYLYFFEKILQSVSDATVTLPYWNWVSDYQVPSQYWSAPFTDTTRVIKTSSQVNPTRTEIAPLLRLKEYRDFGGGSVLNRQPGALESGPHNYVHGWVGGDMGDFATAALDPLFFFAHHSCVDRVFGLWMQVPGHAVPGDDWGSLSFRYWDTNGQPFDILVSDIMKLDIRYEEFTPVLAITPGGGPKPLNAPMTTAEFRLPPATMMVAEAAAATGPDTLIRIEGVTVPTDAPVQVEVRVDVPPNTPGATEGARVIGALTIVPIGDHNHDPIDVTVAVPEDSVQLLRTLGSARLQLVPSAPSEGATMGTISFQSISLEVK